MSLEVGLTYKHKFLKAECFLWLDTEGGFWEMSMTRGGLLRGLDGVSNGGRKGLGVDFKRKRGLRATAKKETGNTIIQLQKHGHELGKQS